MDVEGRLVVAGAPIGNVGDAGPRLAEALASADAVAAEDTRRVLRLASELGIRVRGRIYSCYEAVEATRATELVQAMIEGESVLLITDAGMPGVSDPGYRLVRAAVLAGVPVTVVPGPSAVTAALAVSGLPTDRFCFEGFPARKAGERRRRFAELADEPRTLVFFESKHRLAASLADLAQSFGSDRPAVLCRELTKTHEEVIRGGLGELAEWAEQAAGRPVGEVTLVVAGAPTDGSAAGTQVKAASATELATAVDQLVAAGENKKTALGLVARKYGIPKRQVWSAVHGGGLADLEAGPPAVPVDRR